MVRDVVVLRAERQWAPTVPVPPRMAPTLWVARAHRGAVRFRGGRLEAALELSPR